MPTDGPDLGGTLRAFLRRDHARIEGIHARLMDELGKPAGAVAELWRRFEAALLDHMAVEERHLLRHFGQVRGEEAAALRAEHAEFRRTLARLGADRELHPGDLQGFVAALCDHARREDQLLYRWAEHELGATVQETIARELSGKDRAAALGEPR
jgi:Hemerythrin HHE cation binding domain